MGYCDIIIPVWNQLDVTRDCIASIAKHTSYPYRLIVVDNGSDGETLSYLTGLKDNKTFNLQLIRNENNLGFVKAVNQGIKSSSASYVCIMNNDTIATEGWLSELISILEARSDIGLLNPSSNTSGQFPKKGQSIDEYAYDLKHLKGEIQELYTCRGFCMLVRKEILDKLGPLDETYHMGYFDDTDYCKRAQSEGFRTARAKASYVYHKENLSFKRLKDNKQLFETNEKIFHGRWGKPVRIGYFVDDAAANEKVDIVATDVARSGHQILIFLKKGLPWPVRIDHFDIRKVDLGAVFFGLQSLYQIAKRKKKKKLELLLTDNRLFGAVLRMAEIIHGGRVIIGPHRDAVLSAIREKTLARLK